MQAAARMKTSVWQARVLCPWLLSKVPTCHSRVSSLIGRLAMLAASYELEATDPEAEVYE